MEQPAFHPFREPLTGGIIRGRPFAGMEGRRTDAPIHRDKDLPKFLP